MNKVNNGRVDIKSPNTTALFQMYDKIPANQCVTFRNATEGLWSSTPLSDAFFSQQNILMIQNGIRAGVYNRSNGQYVIGPQDCDSLKIIMRSVFLQHSANQPNNFQYQITELNKIVLNPESGWIKLTPAHINLIDEQTLVTSRSKVFVLGGEAL